MTAIGAGHRGPDFYADMGAEELAAHKARDNGDLSPEMKQFDVDIEAIQNMSPVDRAAVAVMKWEALKNG